MLKTTAFYISFLGLLSLVYHLVYWSRFDIDVFQFIALQDFITGIAYPLRVAIWFALTFLVLIILSYPYVQKNDPRKQDMQASIREATGVAYEDFDDTKVWVDAAHDKNPNGFIQAVNTSKAKWAGLVKQVMIAFIVAPFVIGICYLIFSTVAWLASLTAFLIALTLLVLLHSAHGRFENILGLKSSKKYWTYIVDEFILTMMVFLPINAALAGYTESQRVLTGKSYKYVTAEEVALPATVPAKQKLIYLGKASASYFFVSTDFQQHFVVPVDKVPVLNYKIYTKQ